MAYNAASQATPASNLYDWQNTPFNQSLVQDPNKGVPYTGKDTYSPPEANPEDYWTGTGYSQMPEYGEGEYQSYDPAQQYQPSYIDPSQTDWANANTYAPWSNPMGPGGVESAGQGELMNDPNFWGGGSHGGYDVNNMKSPMDMLFGGFGGSVLSGLPIVNPISNFLNSTIGSIFGSKKKRQSLNYKQPSYQGYMFTPEEGFPNYYNPSQEGQSANATQQDLYSQQPTYGGDLGLAQPQTTGTNSYDYNYTGGGDGSSYGSGGQQSYVGQQDQQYGSLYNQPSSLYETFKA